MTLEAMEEFGCFDDDSGECPECGGDGWVNADCFEDSCCCADESCHGVEPCPLCNPEGD